ncbi:hypothetical protein J6590_047814 [Homalodisca vitripennis]|nr:hypothetical protein J6590_047814 [Homalodisca vitripennis]
MNVASAELCATPMILIAVLSEVGALPSHSTLGTSTRLALGLRPTPHSQPALSPSSHAQPPMPFICAPRCGISSDKIPITICICPAMLDIGRTSMGPWNCPGIPGEDEAFPMFVEAVEPRRRGLSLCLSSPIHVQPAWECEMEPCQRHTNSHPSISCDIPALVISDRLLKYADIPPRL